jgi:hypothetical protein
VLFGLFLGLAIRGGWTCLSCDSDNAANGGHRKARVMRGE